MNALLRQALDVLAPMKGHRLYDASRRAVIQTFSHKGYLAANRHAERILSLYEDATLDRALKRVG